MEDVPVGLGSGVLVGDVAQGKEVVDGSLGGDLG